MILLTGGSGFVGRAVWTLLEERSSVRLALRGPIPAGFPEGTEAV